MNLQQQLWDQYFTEEYLGFELTPLLGQIAATVGYKSQLFKELIYCLADKRENYHYSPTIGANLDFQFTAQTVTLTRLDESQILSKKDFLRLLVLIDKVYGEILPLGSVIQLDKSRLLDKSMLPTEDTLIYAMITGQRVCINHQFYLDYTGLFWPNGLMEKQEPLAISNIMIETVLFRGLEDNPLEDQFILGIRRKLLSLDLDSFYFQQYLAKGD
ncbi:DUF4176 domain-containing protein [Streptococcus intermedius]|uniref:DUF4176 domain-containing protein n=1 Tax=Streptococcus intermedius TaxID=1338 RepID=UPI0002329C4A|nr:DUF4176 domain-containing protein [Streptococcus intermedius]EHG11778.1 hypothetical protein HMPREF9177_01660 [Streptococcus intermedius F0413]QKH77394.1 DUF4176 domain-containing protein [Streptococcus intermedius]